MKKIMILMIVAMIGLVIMSSALKPREDNTQKQTIINEPINVAMVSVGNDNQQIANQNTNKTVLELQESLPEQYKEIELVKIKWGNEKNNLKCTQGAEAWGPLCIALDTLENIYILDNLNGAVKKYNDKGKLIGIYKNEDIEFHNINNMEISENGKYIYGINNGRMEKYIYEYDMEKLFHIIFIDVFFHSSIIYSIYIFTVFTYFHIIYIMKFNIFIFIYSY